MEKAERGSPNPGGIDKLPQGLSSITGALTNLRKEERLTASQPLESDKLTGEELKEMLVGSLSLEEIEDIRQLKFKEMEKDETD